MGKHSFGEQIVQVVLMLILFLLVVRSAGLSRQIQGTSRVINYAGIVRGCSQRVVKRELCGETSDDLIAYLDAILKELREGGDTYQLTSLPDPAYQEGLSRQETQWNTLKKEIAAVRSGEGDAAKAALLSESESYYDLCNETVSLAEQYSEGLIRSSATLWWFLILDLLLQTVIILHRTVIATRVFHRNILMEQKTYLDSLTGVCNRRCYDDLLHELGQGEAYSVIFIDLDHLKLVNDTYGHDAGDRYIQHSVKFIQAQFRTTDMMFRLGGDEFLLYLKGCSGEVALRLISKAWDAVAQDASLGHSCSFSYGICAVGAAEQKSLKEAVHEADQAMYRFKKAHGDAREI